MSIIKQRWAQIFVGGLFLFALADITLRFTDNVNYFPTVMMIGAFLVPVAFVAYFLQQEAIFDRGSHGGSILPTVIMCALLGGLIGTLAAGTLEYTTLNGSSLLSLAWVGPIEEFAKLLVPVALYVIMRNRFRSELDGLLLGVVAGMAFAALETMGYELVTLVSSQGNINALDETILIRGILSPAGHAAWTGLITATLWRERQRTGRAFTALTLVFFLIAASLHTLWDFASSANSLYVLVPAYVAISGVSLVLLSWRLRESRRQPAPERVVAG
jgi:RsiW-degrading membrane proteinase PrsW (M82 family)